ncbi:hypothetical protein Taro_004267 [Colocasia esculenta]|uniref:Uncharacterized protein n=1 Tax=Colocasia esculenta TaxID=4460 RepID=A0A843TR57_COLES|nr:hypothetical protein [Colocasia esculenta]
MESSKKRFWRSGRVVEGETLKKFLAGEVEGFKSGGSRCRGRRDKQQSHKEAITTHKMYPGSELLSTGVLRPVPEQQLRISLTRVQSPYGHYNTQLS